MTAVVLADNAYGTINVALTATDTTMSLTSGHGARFPVVVSTGTGAAPLYACLVDSGNVVEEIKITSHGTSSDTANMVRGVGGTTPKAWGAGARIETRLSKAVFDAIQKEYISVTDPAFGAVADDATDCYAAIQKAHDCLPSAGGMIALPRGILRTSAQLVFSKPVILLGQGAGIVAGLRPTILKPDAGIGGISLTVDSNYSVLRDFYLLSASTIAGTDDGITSKAHGVEYNGLVIDNFGRYALARDTSVSGNCNNDSIIRVRAVNNRSHGFYSKGNNSNVGHFDKCDATTNGGYGFYNDANIQSQHSSCHASGNTTGAFYDNGSSHQYFNPYVEPGTGDTVLFDTGSSYAVWMAGGYSVPTITDNGFLTGIYRKFGWDKKLIVNDSGGPSASNRYSLASGLYLAGYLSLANETTGTNLWNIDGSSLRQEMLINLIMSKRFSAGQGADVASANTLTLGGDGNYFRITGNTQINLITNTNWQGGSQITLFFVSTPTVKHNQAPSGVNRAIVLNAAVDFVAAASNTLTLVYDSTNLAWYEVSRKV